MGTEVKIAIRLEEELRDKFNESALYEHRPASQVLRELMRGYIQQVEKQRQLQAETARPVTGADDGARDRREQAVNFARASVGLEGFKTSAEDEALARRFIDGHIDLAAFIQGSDTPAQDR